MLKLFRVNINFFLINWEICWYVLLLLFINIFLVILNWKVVLGRWNLLSKVNIFVRLNLVLKCNVDKLIDI